MTTPDSRLTFGILGTAGIARKAVVPAIAASDHALGAVASRDGERAERFAEEHAIPRSYDSYEALLEDDEIDAVYVPLPNGLHAEWTKRAADAGHSRALREAARGRRGGSARGDRSLRGAGHHPDGGVYVPISPAHRARA